MESEQLFLEIQELKAKVESIDYQQSLLIRAQRDKLLPLIKGLLKRKRNLRKIYLSIDGRRNVSDISGITGIHQPDVTKGCSELAQFGLIELVLKGKAGTVYRRSICEKIFRLSSWIKKEYPNDV